MSILSTLHAATPPPVAVERVMEGTTTLREINKVTFVE